MEIDNPDETNGSSDGTKENGLHFIRGSTGGNENEFVLYPVSVNHSGEGLPYAPIDFPNPGDKWSWKVGRRIACSGYFLDRYLYAPPRLRDGVRKKGFASKLSLEQYIRTTFPGADVNAFFASFSWKIPSIKMDESKGNELGFAIAAVPSRGVPEHSESDSLFGTVTCKAGNKMCSSLVEGWNLTSEAMFCDVCCAEPGFCRDCCCILCSKTINLAYEGYSFIRCEATVAEGFICGHIAHIECGLRSYMAGTVGGSIGLDAEYCCRRCDMRTDLVSHVTKLLHTCESVVLRDDIEKILNVGVCILRGSQKTSAKGLLHHIELAKAKLKSGTCLEDVWNTENISAVAAGGMSCNGNDDALENVNHEEPPNSRIGSPQILSGKFDYQIESLKLKDEIDQVLQALRKSQESEYRIAEEMLITQKNYLLDLHRQLDEERSELSRHRSGTRKDSLLRAVLNREDQIQREVMKLKDMEEVAKGFGRTSKDILEKHFGMEIR